MKLAVLLFLIVIVMTVALTQIFLLGKIANLGIPSFLFSLMNRKKTPQPIAGESESPYLYTFNVDGVLEETDTSEDSPSKYWWVNSGAELIIQNGIGKTIQGELSTRDSWRLNYLSHNPEDTDNGFHPQNIFRLLTKNKWQDFEEEMFFKIDKLNMSKSPNRNSSNGVLLFMRYQNSDNLYYAGVRVDGSAIIKKKINGEYYTLAEAPLYASDAAYDRDITPNVIPGKQWIGLRVSIKNNSQGGVLITLYTDTGRTGTWKFAAQAVDNGKTFDGGAIQNEGHAGIRTDFMDVEFDDYQIRKI